MAEFVTIKEGTKLTDKSYSSIRRFVERIVGDEQSDERSLIQPSPDEVRQLKADKQPFSWQISRELLFKHFPRVEPGDKARSQDTSKASEATNDVAVLQVALKTKDEHLSTVLAQLQTKDEQINRLNDNLYAQNVLMKQLQDKLALPEPSRARKGLFGLFA